MITRDVYGFFSARDSVEMLCMSDPAMGIGMQRFVEK